MLGFLSTIRGVLAAISRALLKFITSACCRFHECARYFSEMILVHRMWRTSKLKGNTSWTKKRGCRRWLLPGACLFLFWFFFIDWPYDYSLEDESEEDKNDHCFRNPDAPVATWDYYPNKTQQIVREPEINLDPSKCASIMETLPTVIKQQPAFDPVCEGYDGVLHIQQGDSGGASGTVFFQFVVGMLQWADQHNYIPFVHFNEFSTKIYDEKVHSHGDRKTFAAMEGMDIEFARDAHDPENCLFPGRPVLMWPGGLRKNDVILEGTGVWEHYFQPVSPFDPRDPSCEALPLVTMSYNHIVFGIHSQAPWAPHPWRYLMPAYIEKTDIPLQDWLMEQRPHAVRTTQRYIRFTPHMEQRAACAHPRPPGSLGMHIRHADKQLSRSNVPVDNFLEFAQSFVDAGEGGDIYVATDSKLVLEEIFERWPKKVRDRIVYQKGVQGLSRNETAAFDLGVSVHRTNTEALTDLLALSKCTYLLHGLSALSEAVFFLNPGLMKRAVNLDDIEADYTTEYFVNKILPQGKGS